MLKNMETTESFVRPATPNYTGADGRIFFFQDLLHDNNYITVILDSVRGPIVTESANWITPHPRAAAGVIAANLKIINVRE